MEDPLRITSLKRKTIPKVAVLAAGLTAAVVAVTMTTAPAQASPGYASACNSCHSAGGSVAATPSSATLAPGAAYTVALAFTGGSSPVGYWVSGNGASVTASNAGPVSMTAPAAAGSYTYTVWMRSGVVASTTYTITVAAAPVVVTTTTALAVTPASPVVAPGSPTLKATVSGAGAAGTVEFFNGTTSLGTPSAISAGVASKTLTGVVAGSYSYKAVFTPTDAAAFTSSTSAVSTYVVTAPVPAPTASFTASAISGIAPLAVTLTDTSIGSPTSWLWTFGNGSTSNMQNPPAVTYTTAGTYDVTLIVSNASGASAPVTQTITVTDPAPVVIAPVISALSPANGAIGDTVTITGTGFGTVGTVMFGTTVLDYTSADGLSIDVVAPIGVRRAKVTVTPTDGDSANTASNSVIFKYDRIARVK
jgi:PKD repeat protein